MVRLSVWSTQIFPLSSDSVHLCWGGLDGAIPTHRPFFHPPLSEIIMWWAYQSKYSIHPPPPPRVPASTSRMRLMPQAKPDPISELFWWSYLGRLNTFGDASLRCASRVTNGHLATGSLYEQWNYKELNREERQSPVYGSLDQVRNNVKQRQAERIAWIEPILNAFVDFMVI